MEDISSFNKQLREEKTARVVINKKTKMLDVDIGVKINKIFGVDKEIETIQKAIRRRRQKNRKNRDLSSRFSELKSIKTDIRNKIDALEQISSLIEEVKDEFKPLIKEIKKQTINFPKENLFDFTVYVKKQKEENEIDLCLFLELEEEKKIVYNQTPVNNLIQDVANLKNGFFTNSYFRLGDEGEIDTEKFLEIVMK